MKMVNWIRLLAVFSSFFIFWGSLNAQNECGTDEMIVRNPFFQQLYAERVACAPEVDLDTAQVLSIPVVFHIIHLGEPVGEGTNISDEQVLSCIENLNHRFRADTAALAPLVSAYSSGDPAYDEYELSLAIDSKIEFCLAARDPDNNPTDGIIRHDGSNLSYTNNFSGQTSTAYYAEDGVTNGSQYDIPLQGIPDAIMKDWFHWPVDKYFNFYVVSEINGNNGGGGVQGYSYVGSLGTGANGESYGPVCLYNVTGTVGSLKQGHSLNTTPTHEVGHALDLYHTFGVFGGSCDPESNPCSQGDQVPDTPPTSTNQSCNFPNCPDAMVENYMDYTGEQCKIAFTQGQIERMRDEIYTGLPYLVSSNNVSCQSPNSKDVAVTFTSLPSNWCLETIDFSVKINNFGGEDAEGVILSVNGQTVELGIIPAGEYTLVYYYDFELGDGIVDVEVIYDLDEFLDNNTLTEVVDIVEQNWVEVIISPDVWSNEIDWEITDENGEIVLYGGDWPVFSDTIDYYEASCLSDGCYTFTITDSGGDGLCSFDFDEDGICDYSYDSFINIFSNDLLIFDLSDPGEMNYGGVLEFNFCVEVPDNCPPSDCPTDLDGDGTTGIHDLMNLLIYIGLEGECDPTDFNFDGITDINDVLTFLNSWGYVCATGENILGPPPGWVLNYVENSISNVTEITNDYNGVCLLGPPLYFDLTGRKVNNKGRLAPGIYLVVEKWTNGDVTTKKILINSWNTSIER